MTTRVDQFIAHVQAVKDSPEAIKTLCQQEMEYIEKYYTTDASRKTHLTPYRNAIREARLATRCLSLMRLPKKRTRALNVANAMRVAAHSEHPEAIIDYRALVEEGLTSIESSSYARCLLGLALLSGRRPIELCITGDFAEDNNHPPRHVWFQGQAKTRDIERANESYRIPLLCDTEQFVDAWARFLTLKDFSAYNPELHGKDAIPFTNCAKDFAVAYQRYFARFMPAGTSVRNLRHAYGLIAYHTVRAANDPVRITPYLKVILGHDDILPVTAHSYLKYYLADFPIPE